MRGYSVIKPGLILAVLLFAVPVFGQADRGTITGIVQDANGAAVPGATVTVTNQANNGSSSAVTSSDGIYVIPALPAGTYKVRVSARDSNRRRSSVSPWSLAIRQAPM